MLRPIALLTAFLMFASPAIAADPASVVATKATVVTKKDGFHFEYTTELRSDDHIHIYGRDLDRRNKFSLVVAPDGRVSGSFDKTPVSFSVSAETARQDGRFPQARQAGECRSVERSGTGRRKRGVMSGSFGGPDSVE